jgi:hypothetical protein
MADDREQEMLELMSDIQQMIRQLQNTLNEMWAEWTRTHSSTVMKNVPVPPKVSRRVLR